MLAVVACGVAWVVLVLAAIEFGHSALGGHVLAWAFTGAATVGAIGCLLLLFSLVGRAQRMATVAGDARPPAQVAPPPAGRVRPSGPAAPALPELRPPPEQAAPAPPGPARRSDQERASNHARARRSSGGRRAAR